MSDNDFYEDDEPTEKIEAEWDRGEEVVTVRSSRDLNQRAAGIVDRAVQRFEAPPVPEAITVNTSDWFGVDPSPRTESTTDTRTTRDEAPVNA